MSKSLDIVQAYMRREAIFEAALKRIAEYPPQAASTKFMRAIAEEALEEAGEESVR